MKKLGGLLLISSCLACGDSLTTYNNQAEWTAATNALPNVTVESFQFQNSGSTNPDISLNILEYPNTSWSTANGTITLTANPHTTPYLTFSKPTYAFGADFNYTIEGGLGMNLNSPEGFPLNAVVDPPNSPDCLALDSPCASFNGFFGFISSDPFTSLYFETTMDGGRYGQTFIMSNGVFGIDPPGVLGPGTSTPEPATWGLMILASILLTAFKFARH